VRTTWRSNTASLITDRTIWRRQPWCVYAIFLTSLVNFAIVWDPILLMTLWMAVRYTDNASTVLGVMGAWMLSTKLLKTHTYYMRHPKDIVFLPLAILYGYFHSFLKLYALFTFYVTAWGGRVGVE
jgi:hypothetical protein